MADDNENLARLTSVRTEMEAGVIVSGLEDRGIKSTMSGVYTTNFRAEAPGWVEILVADHDLARAQAALEEIRVENDHIDWSQVDVGQPEDE
jgi:Putative prokaryotic signal transducing protein